MAEKMTLVIVESPTKAKTIRKFLPKNYVVEASFGHVRDLPQSAADIPAKLKAQEWTKIGVNVEENFDPLYVIPKGKSKVIQELKRKMADADELYLATDEDREGESISWHLLEVLKPKIPVKRMVFHEITKSAILQALKETREVDTRLVRAQETRRILDRLVGYTLSPLIWKKIAFGLSAGRVQSVALKLIVERERERLKFKKGEYYDIEATLKKASEEFSAKLTHVDGARIATGKDFDETTGKVAADSKVKVLSETEAAALSKDLKTTPFTVESVEEKTFQSRPYPPFITSTLQQEGGRKLNLSARETMRTAQSLYEQGFITYMRTDSPNLSSQALSAARAQVLELYGKEYLSPEPRQFASKNKQAQEAHEAIRPSGSEFVHPKETGLSGIELALYELIWKRTLASQMSEAKKLSIAAKIHAKNAIFQANGTRILFPGYLRVYVEGSDDPDQSLEDRETLLPELKKNETVNCKDLEALFHETKPPARFTEASLVQTLEKESVGRPSTYASIMGTITERGYVKKVQAALIPTFTGFAVTQLLEKHFSQFVDVGFTSKMENSLDEIAEGKIDYLPYLKAFYLGKEGLLERVKVQDKKIDPNESRTLDLANLKNIEVKVGRYGAYLVKTGEEISAAAAATSNTKKKKSTALNEEVHASIPEDLAPSDLNNEKIKEILEISERGPIPIGVDPKSKLGVFVKTGRFGPYVQLGEQIKDSEEKPRRASIPKGVDSKSVTLDQALTYLSLPRELGVHPESKKPILANLGRFGPYVQHEKDYRSLKKEDNVYTVTLERALALLSEEKKGRASKKLLKELGKHPSDEKTVSIFDGKFGSYLNHGKVNVTLPEGYSIESITLEQALPLLEAKAGAPKKGRFKKR